MINYIKYLLAPISNGIVYFEAELIREREREEEGGCEGIDILDSPDLLYSGGRIVHFRKRGH